MRYYDNSALGRLRLETIFSQYETHMEYYFVAVFAQGMHLLHCSISLTSSNYVNQLMFDLIIASRPMGYSYIYEGRSISFLCCECPFRN